MSVTVKEVDEEDLPPQFRDGLQALRRAHPHQDIEPLIERGNMVVVSLGTFDVTRELFDEDTSDEGLIYIHDEYEVFVRLPRPFPNGNLKGFGTSPPLERADRAQVKNNPNWSPEIQDAHEQYHDGPVEWYSWKWEGFPTSDAEHAKAAYDLAERMLKHG